MTGGPATTRTRNRKTSPNRRASSITCQGIPTTICGTTPTISSGTLTLNMWKQWRYELTPDRSRSWCCGGDRLGAAERAVRYPWASAAPCPDVEVVFARGTTSHLELAGSARHLSIHSARRLAPGPSGCIRSTTRLPTITLNPPPSVPAMRVLMSSPWRRTVRTPGWCSVDIPKARS